MSQIESPLDEPMLCVSIHDVAPATWSDCLRLVEAVRAVADIPLTWLVVPHYHFRPEQSPAMEACLNVALERGDELALHGYSHLDTEAAGGGLRTRFLRNVYTRREGEFAALTEAEARRRLELGLDWFAARGWTPTGFVPPAWLLGEGAWRALRDAPFAYTTTFSHFHCLPGTGAHHPNARPQRQRAPYGAGDRAGDSAGYRGDSSASVQGGSGVVQTAQGNRAGQGAGNRQFDPGTWTGAASPDLRQDMLSHATPSHATPSHATPSRDHAPEPAAPGTTHVPQSPQPPRSPQSTRVPQSPQSPQSTQVPQAPDIPPTRLAQNNRRGTHAILSPSLVYAARNRGGRILSPRVADATAAMLAQSPLVRFSLHPPDARYPELVRHIQHVLERLLERREAVTKAEFARRVAVGLTGFTSTDPTSRPANSQDPSRSSREAVQHAGGRTSPPG